MKRALLVIFAALALVIAPMVHEYFYPPRYTMRRVSSRKVM